MNRQFESKYNWILFFISPFISVVYALGNNRSSNSWVFVWMFFAFFGFTFHIPRETMDAAAYRDKLIEDHENSISFTQFNNTLYNSEMISGETDILEPFVRYFVSKFTSDYRILFMVFALIYGFFYTKILYSILDIVSNKKDFLFILLFLAFAIVSPIWYISGFRWYTAVTVLFYLLIHFFKSEKKAYLLATIVVPFIHYSFIVVLPLILVFFFLRKRTVLFFSIFIISQFISNLGTADITNLIPADILPDVFIEQSDSYLDSDRASRLASGKSNKVWYARLYGDFYKWTIYILLVIAFIKNRVQILSDRHLRIVFSFAFLVLAFASLIQNVPSMGRFTTLGFYSGFYAFLLYYIKLGFWSSFKKIYRYIAFPGITLYCSIVIKNGLEVFSIITIVGNPIVAYFTDNSISLFKWINFII